MKLIQVCFLTVFMFIGLTGCRDKVNIEDITMSLLLGIDVNEEGKVEMFMSSPVFSEEAKEKNEHFEVKTLSMKEARNYFDTMATGITSGGKVQAILIGSKMIEHKNWYSTLDFLYRDPKLRLNADIVFVNGSVSDVFDLDLKDKPRLSIFLPQLLETANFREVAVRTSLRKYYQMYYEKGITPFAPELSIVENKLKMTGTTLLNDQNLYSKTLSMKETQLFKILNDKVEGQLSYTLALDKFKKDVDIFKENAVSFYAKDIRRRIHKKYKNGQYKYNINLKMPIVINESPIKLNDQTEKSLRDEIEKELEKELNDLVRSFQQAKVDPLGLGIYASAFNHSVWKKNDDKWISFYEKAKIKVNVEIIIFDKGISM
ncbi:Ger(x)C family spore germination protein [Bacillus sp. OAE603]|uniref:Ger(x)C family spore germination protein n=1 Tax=Gottfriedia sp. OAE603 TaxID=2663872 RepID=UPI00178AEDFF